MTIYKYFKYKALAHNDFFFLTQEGDVIYPTQYFEHIAIQDTHFMNFMI